MPAGDTPQPPRRHGPRPLGALTAAFTRPVLRRLNPGTAQILADWEALVGPGLAARTIPRRLDRGTLTIGCAGPTALELTMLGPALMQRINAGLGRQAVQRLRFAPAALPPPATPRAAMPPAALPATVAARLEAMPEGPLRGALEKLAQGVYQGGHRKGPA